MSLPDVNRVPKRTKRGVTYYYYHRQTGARIIGAPNTPEFLASYIEAANKPTVEIDCPKGTFASLLVAYKGSPKFRNLAPSSQRNYSIYIDRLEERFAKVSLKAISDRKFRGEFLSWRDEIARESQSTAELLTRVMKVVLRFGEDRVMLSSNPLQGVERLKFKDHSSNVFTAQQIKRLIEVSPKELIWAIKLALLTGQRQGDLIRLKWTDIANGALRLCQQKTKADVTIPIGASLAALLSEIPRRAETILTSTHGKPWCSDGSSLRQAWARAMVAAKLHKTGLRFHDLRGTAITCLADMGCNEIQIAAMTGHEIEHVSRILKAYLKRTPQQTQAAVKSLELSWIGQLQN